MNKHVNAVAAESSAPRAAPEPLANRYQAGLDMISQGVCFFDRESRLLFANRSYAEIYRLPREVLTPGVSLREIAERRRAAGTCPMAVDDYLAYCDAINSTGELRIWSAELGDGRNVRVRHQPTSEGGWASIHDDITMTGRARLLAEQQTLMQALIDNVPAYLWVKDCDSRFLAANHAMAVDSGRARAEDMVGLTDFDLHEPLRASEFRRRELDVILTGAPMLDTEELVIDAQGRRKWLLSSKSPLRDARGEIFGLAGVAQDITARKQAESLRRGWEEVLDMIAIGGPAKAVLARLLRLIESQSPGVAVACLRVDDDGLRLRHAVASNLPTPLRDATEGLPIDARQPSLAVALARRAPAISLDLVDHPDWGELGALAASNGYRACWATPILGAGGAALGVLASFAAETRGPSDEEAHLAQVAGGMAAIVIDRERLETALTRAKLRL